MASRWILTESDIIIAVDVVWLMLIDISLRHYKLLLLLLLFLILSHYRAVYIDALLVGVCNSDHLESSLDQLPIVIEKNDLLLLLLRLVLLLHLLLLE